MDTTALAVGHGLANRCPFSRWTARGTLRPVTRSQTFHESAPTSASRNDTAQAWARRAAQGWARRAARTARTHRYELLILAGTAGFALVVGMLGLTVLVR